MNVEPIVNYALRDRVLEIKSRSENQEKVLTTSTKMNIYY